MIRYRAPYGNGYYEIGQINEKWVAVIYDDAFDMKGFQIVEDLYSELCDSLVNIYFLIRRRTNGGKGKYENKRINIILQMFLY